MDADKPTTEIGHDFQPGTRWGQSRVAEHYDNLGGACDWVLGYPFMIRELVRDATPESVLDLGCGPARSPRTWPRHSAAESLLSIRHRPCSRWVSTATTTRLWNTV